MKKLLFLFMLIGAASQLKAQAKFELKPFNKVLDSLTRSTPQIPNRVNSIAFGSSKNKDYSSQKYAYNPMPVVKTEGRSNMPVVKMEGNSKMPVINPDAGVTRIITKELP